MSRAETRLIRVSGEFARWVAEESKRRDRSGIQFLDDLMARVNTSPRNVLTPEPRVNTPEPAEKPISVDRQYPKTVLECAKTGHAHRNPITGLCPVCGHQR